VLYSPLLPLFKGKFWTLTGGKVGPLLLFVLIETAEEGHIAIKSAKLGERDRAVERVNDTGIELAHHIEHPHSRLIEISSADIPCVGEQLGLDPAARRPFDCEPKVVPREERVSGDPGDRQTYLIGREFDRGWHRLTTVAGRQK